MPRTLADISLFDGDDRNHPPVPENPCTAHGVARTVAVRYHVLWARDQTEWIAVGCPFCVLDDMGTAWLEAVWDGQAWVWDWPAAWGGYRDAVLATLAGTDPGVLAAADELFDAEARAVLAERRRERHTPSFPVHRAETDLLDDLLPAVRLWTYTVRHATATTAGEVADVFVRAEARHPNRHILMREFRRDADYLAPPDPFTMSPEALAAERDDA